jgi:hypothetical protein
MTVKFARIVNFPNILSVDVLHIPWISRKIFTDKGYKAGQQMIRCRDFRVQNVLMENSKRKSAVIMSRKARNGL